VIVGIGRTLSSPNPGHCRSAPTLQTFGLGESTVTTRRFDGTEREVESYAKHRQEIAREMLYVFSVVDAGRMSAISRMDVVR
jgi:hypothetical protein